MTTAARECENCDGTGRRSYLRSDGRMSSMIERFEPCNDCGGTGLDVNCPVCQDAICPECCQRCGGLGCYQCGGGSL